MVAQISCTALDSKMSIKKTIFMTKKFLSDIRKPKSPYQISDDLHGQILGPYYFDFIETEIKQYKHQSLIKSYDRNGIPLNKPYIDVGKDGLHYYPITIGQYGLSVFKTYLCTGSSNDKSRFLKFVDWFFNHGETQHQLGVRWLTDVPLPQYRNAGPWQSAFAQSRGISILLRGFQLTRKSEYAEMSERALIPFTKPVLEGGVTSYTEWGPFYEEYTAEVPTLVLNGMIFSICGVYDFVRVFPDNGMAQRIFSDGIQTLKNILSEYDLGYWSRYNLCKADWYPRIDPSTVGYQRLHVVQLRMLYRLTGEALFKQYAITFEEQDKLINILRMYRVKLRALKMLKRL
jgi:hypothetical protein